MSENDATVLMRVAAKRVLIEGRGVRLDSVPVLGIAKLQILSNQPDAWFKETLGLAAPMALQEMEAGPVAFAWLAPGEWLVTGPPDDVECVRRRCAEASGALGLMIDLSHARATFELSGAGARSVLAAHCPLDLDDFAMPVGAAMRSAFSDTGFFVSHRPDREGEPCFRLIFDQTMASYAERMLGATIMGAFV